MDGKERARAAGAPDCWSIPTICISATYAPRTVPRKERWTTSASTTVRFQPPRSWPWLNARRWPSPTGTASRKRTLDVPIASGVLANDHDPNGQALVAILEGAPPAGLVFRGDGSFTYTPPAETAGLATFSYRASDGNLLSDPVAVAIRIDAPPMTVTSFTAGPAQVAAEFSKPLHAASAGPGSVLVTGAGPDQVFDTPDDLAAQGSIQLLDGNRIQFTPQAGTLPDDRYRIRFRSTGALAASAPQSNAGADGVDLRAVSPVLGGASGLLSLT